MSTGEKEGFFGSIKKAAIDGGWIEGESPEGDTSTQQSAAPAVVISPSPAAVIAPSVNQDLVEQLRKIALAPANSPLTNTFMRSLEKARKIETDQAKAIKMALTFSDVPVKDLVKEIESAVSANLAGHEHSFANQIGTQREAVNTQFAERQAVLERAISADQALAEEIRQRLAANTTANASLAGEKAAEVAKIDKIENEAQASLAVVKDEINSLLTSLKAG